MTDKERIETLEKIVRELAGKLGAFALALGMQAEINEVFRQRLEAMEINELCKIVPMKGLIQ